MKFVFNKTERKSISRDCIFFHLVPDHATASCSDSYEHETAIPEVRSQTDRAYDTGPSVLKHAKGHR